MINRAVMGNASSRILGALVVIEENGKLIGVKMRSVDQGTIEVVIDLEEVSGWEWREYLRHRQTFNISLTGASLEVMVVDFDEVQQAILLPATQLPLLESGESRDDR